MTLKAQVKVVSEGTEGLTIADIAAFCEQVPEQARAQTPTLIMGDRGNQRDPFPYLRGLSVEWDHA